MKEGTDYISVLYILYKFNSEESAIEYMESRLIKLNEESKIEEEKKQPLI